MKLIYALVLAVLVGCAAATTQPQKIYQAQNNYNAALTVAVAYKNLPACPITPVCSKPEIVKDLQDADDIAAPALDRAQKLVRAGDVDAAQAAIEAANVAITALTAITNKLVVKEAK